jgi:hypothetical protein
VVAIAFALLFASMHARAQTATPHSVVIRAYNTIGVSLQTLERAEATARELLRNADIESGWRECRTPDGPTSRSRDACDDMLNPSEVIIRIVRAPRSVADPETLGYSHVDPYSRQGTLATVFADRVRALAPALRIDEGTLLGRAITHEVGHLLLGTLDHTQQGLMRSHWSKQGRAWDWFFSSTQAQQIRVAIANRTNGAPSALALARSTK